MKAQRQFFGLLPRKSIVGEQHKPAHSSDLNRKKQQKEFFMKTKSNSLNVVLLVYFGIVCSQFSPACAQSYLLSANVNVGAPPLTVDFSVSGGTYEGWNEYYYAFGDGSSDSSYVPFDSHTYTNSGTYYPEVFVTPSGVFGYSSQIFVAPVNSFAFTTNNDGSLNISSYTGSGGAVTIPDTTNGLPVTSIGSGAFETVGGTYLSSITMSTNIADIGSYAFSGCGSAYGNLQSIVIPDSVTNIGDYAFSRISSITNIFIGANVQSIGIAVFNYDYNLVAITANPSSSYFSTTNGILFNKSQTTLIACPIVGIYSYIIPNSVTSISAYAFFYCYNLTNVTIPSTVTSLGDFSFQLSSLTSVAIPCSVTNVGNSVFDSSRNLTSVTINNTIIGQNEFSYSMLTSVVIPNNVTSIGNDAFDQDSSLTNVTIGTNVNYIGNGAFGRCNELQSIVFPNSVTSIGGNEFEEDYGLTNVVFGTAVTTIGSYAFYYCSNMPTITIPSGVTNIGSYAFEYCSKLGGITIPDSVTGIGNGICEDCYCLTNATIGNNLTNVANATFFYCTNLSSVTFGDNISLIGNQAFTYCSALKTMIVPNGVTYVGSSVFEYCSALTNVLMPAGLTGIGEGMCYDCPALTGVYFEGNSPSPTNDTSVFTGDSSSLIVYYSPATTGWGATFDGIPTATWSPPEIIATSAPIISANAAGFSQSAGGAFQFAFTNTPGASFTIFGSSNMALPFSQWSNLGAAVESPPGSGQFTFADPNATNNPNYYYRVRSP